MATADFPISYTSLTYTQPLTQPHLIKTPLQQPKGKEILVKVKAAAINPVDIQLWGNPLIGYLAGKKEKGIGRDYSGEVVAIGDEVEKWKVGDEVYGLCVRNVSRTKSSQKGFAH
jgi:reticulon-4-interacting protein 1, mitochondrial